MIEINKSIVIRDSQLDFRPMRSQGAGGQNVNKVSTAVHLFFDIRASTLPEQMKAKLLQVTDQRITKEGVVVIKSQSQRSLEANKRAAEQRLLELIQENTRRVKARKATKASKSSQAKRLQGKAVRSSVKKMRGKTGMNGGD